MAIIPLPSGEIPASLNHPTPPPVMTSAPSSRTYGKLISELPQSDEYLTLHFSPGTAPRKQRWRNYGLSADFLGDYFATFFPGNDPGTVQPNRQESVKGAVSFIANELIENAVKYSNTGKDYPITIALYLYQQQIIFQVINYCDRPSAASYQSFVEQVVQSDIETIYTQQLEKAAIGEANSCMGILTMINDYEATFGWKFQDIIDDDTSIQVTVVASLPV